MQANSQEVRMGVMHCVQGVNSLRSWILFSLTQFHERSEFTSSFTSNFTSNF